MGAQGTQGLLFATAAGTCGLAWRGDVVTRFVLPGDEGAVRRLLALGRRGVHGDADAPLVRVADGPRWVAALAAAVRTHVAGGGDGEALRAVPVDLAALPPFSREVYEHVRTVPRGATTTYGAVAASVGRPGGAQAVGAAMGANPVPLLVPCHRVVGADGGMVGFSGRGGVEAKRRLLEAEGASVVAQGRLFG